MSKLWDGACAYTSIFHQGICWFNWCPLPSLKVTLIFSRVLQEAEEWSIIPAFTLLHHHCHHTSKNICSLDSTYSELLRSLNFTESLWWTNDSQIYWSLLRSDMAWTLNTHVRSPWRNQSYTAWVRRPSGEQDIGFKNLICLECPLYLLSIAAMTNTVP